MTIRRNNVLFASYQMSVSQGQEGVSLIEFIIYTALIIIVVGAAVGFAVFQIRAHRTVQHDIAVGDNGRTIIEQVVRDLRLADPSTIAFSTSVVAGNPCNNNYAPLKDTNPQVIYPCIRFTTLPQGEGINGETIEYQYGLYYQDSDSPPRLVKRKIGIGTAEPISDLHADFFGFNVYFNPSLPEQTPPRITVYLTLMTGNKSYSFQNTVFLDSSYEVIPPKAP